MSKVHNFSAGPAILPQVALQAGVEAIQNFKGTGLSILEVSHRSKEFIEVMEEARYLVKKLWSLPENYEVLYLQGGASMQFLSTAYNLLKTKAAYIDTGMWSSKSIKEAKLIGEVDVIASSKDKNYMYIPKDYHVPKDADYLYFTSNNTIFGSQYHQFPKSSIPMVCDMSSDVFSREIDATKFGLIFAGAQKNLGPAGVTLVAVDTNLLGKTGRNIPSMLDYQVHIDKESMFNTPPAFGVYVVLETLKWIEAKGIDQLEIQNRAKAELLYKEIDTNPRFVNNVAKEDRSMMNATFLLTDESETEAFMAACKEAKISGIKGHRSVGGFRASMYNAMEIDSVEALVNVMQTF